MESRLLLFSLIQLSPAFRVQALPLETKRMRIPNTPTIPISTVLGFVEARVIKRRLAPALRHTGERCLSS